MSATTFFVTLIFGWVLLYLAAPCWLMLRGWVVSAGSTQLIGALLPGIWHGVFWPEEAGNFGLLMMMLVPLPACIISVGLVILLFRVGRWGLNHVRRKLT